MKIALIIADIRKTGGTERATINLANMICDEHAVNIVSMSAKGNAFFPLSPRVQLTFLDLPPIPQSIRKKPLWYLKFYKKAKQVLSAEKPQLVLGAGHNISTLLPLINPSQSKAVALEHIDWSSIPRFSQFLMRWSYPHLDAVVALSPTARKKLAPLNSQVKIIPNSLPFQNNAFAALEEKKLLMMGRLSKEKGYERILPIAGKLAVDYPEWNIFIYGEGEQKETLQQALKKVHLKNVHFMAPVKEVKNVYLNSSILLMTSYYEAMPMVILEAQHCGLPVMGYSCEGTDSLIEDGVNGFIAHTESDFYEKLVELIKSKDLRLMFGLHGKEKAERFNQQNIKKKWLEFLNRY